MPRITVCPTVDASTLEEYNTQLEVVRVFASHLHIDIMDGDFAPVQSPSLNQIWWPHGITADIHAMYRRPMDHLADFVRLKPHMVIVHAEAEVHHMHFAAELHKHGIKSGLAILQDTPVDNIKQIMHSFDQVLVFSGHLGFQGGTIDLGLTSKVAEIYDYYPEVQIAWDGGINDQNAHQLIEAGVRVLNVGGFIQKSNDPKAAYATLMAMGKQGV